MHGGQSKPHGLWHKIAHELKQVGLVTLYFLIGFNLLALMLSLLAPGYRDTRTLFVTATVSALVVGKVMVVVDAILAKRLSPTTSFARLVVTKTVIFTLAVLVAMALEEVVHGVVAGDLTWSEALRHTIEEASLQRFVARFVYLSTLFALYSFLFELDRYLPTAGGIGALALSRYRQPVERMGAVMHVRFSDPIPPDRALARARFVRDLFPEFEAIVRKHGTELVSYSGRQGLIRAPDADSGAESLRKVFDELSKLIARHGARLAHELGVEPRLVGGIAAGPLHVVEVAGGASRGIVVDGDVIDRAVELGGQAEPGTLRVATDLLPVEPQRSA